MEEPAHPSPTPLPSTAPEATEPLVLVLTPVKNAWGHLDRFWKNLNALDYPKSRISVAFLESDSDDHGAPEGVSTMGKLESLAKSQGAAFRRVQVFSKSFGVALKRSERHGEEAQLRRRAVMARSRNYLLSRALDDEAYVLWIDSDLHSYPAGVLRGLLASGKDIVTPNAVMSPGSRSYDLNAWQAPRVKLSWGGLAVPPAADITAASLRRMTTSSLVASCASSARVHSSKGMPKDGAAWASEAALATAADSLDRLLDPAPAQAPAAGNSTIRPRTLASEETQPAGTTGRPVVATDGNTSQQRSSMLPRENLSKLDAAAKAEEEPVDARATPTEERARPSKLDGAVRAEEEEPVDARATPMKPRARPSKLDGAVRAEEEPVDARATPTGERARPSKLDAAAKAEEEEAMDARATPTEERARPSKLDAAVRAEEEEAVDARATPTGERARPSKLDAAARAEEEPVDARATPTGERARPSKLDAAARAEEEPVDARATPTEERARPSRLDAAVRAEEEPVDARATPTGERARPSKLDAAARAEEEPVDARATPTGERARPSKLDAAVRAEEEPVDARATPTEERARPSRLDEAALVRSASAEDDDDGSASADDGSRRTARLAGLPAAEVASATGLPAEVAACLVTSAQRIVGRGGAAAKGASEPAAVESECRPLWPLREADAGSSAGAVRAGAAADGDADAGTGRSRWTTGWGEWADGPELLVEGYRPTGNLPLSKLRGDGNVTRVVELDGVGGAMLLIRADLHREGLVFPPAPYRRRIETEGLAMMARDMGHRAWGMPNLEVVHH
ncbi:hypothetical protein FNF29_07350 [Cafeteria roenbergensis]|uniref:Uncharacterized protein n=1 Tax=Cafeteria roenbergensis TaxID=33653 RepID=A0A5A8C453_CAFRO|nr:hypothetical protein FNF29_07350 [Cafeteria roenbergensis]|eukprot:KAA0147504.1 hypothetical protein FNF29_07350 [Cafeteria roenbergensis]